MIKKLREMGADEEAEEAETKLRMEMKKSKGMDNDSEIEETNSKLKEAYLRRRRTNRR